MEKYSSHSAGWGRRRAPVPANPRYRETSRPFGGAYRIIDFTLSNCINSGLRRILVLTQYKSLDLIRHLRDGWNILARNSASTSKSCAMRRVSDDWYQGTADAVFQNFQSIEAEAPKLTLILAGDHIYKMNYREMLDWHRLHNADVTIATIQAPPEEASRSASRDRPGLSPCGLRGKPQHGNPARSRFDPDMVSASMGIYVFNTTSCWKRCTRIAQAADSSHDFGHDVIPRILARTRVVAVRFRDLKPSRAATGAMWHLTPTTMTW